MSSVGSPSFLTTGGGGGDAAGAIHNAAGGGEGDGDGDGDDDDDEDLDDDSDDSEPADVEADVPPSRSYLSPFDRRQVNKVNAARPRIRGFKMPSSGDPRYSYPCPFPVTGDTQYERVFGRLQGKAPDEISFVYNVCAWLQSMHNRLLDAELRKVWQY